MQVRFGDHHVKNGELLSIEQVQNPISVEFKGHPSKLYALAMYDLDAPRGKYIHFLEVNAPGGNLEKGSIRYRYEPPNPPPETRFHTYIIDLLEQGRQLPVGENLGARTPFPIESYYRSAGLTPVQQISFEVPSPGTPVGMSRSTTGYSCGCGAKRPSYTEWKASRVTGQSCGIQSFGETRVPDRTQTSPRISEYSPRVTGQSCGCSLNPASESRESKYSPRITGQSSKAFERYPTVDDYLVRFPGDSETTFKSQETTFSKTKGYGNEYFQKDAPLAPADQKYCRCIMHVAGKEPEQCTREEAWGERRGGKRCANPYAVCHATVKGESGIPECTEFYNYRGIPDNELRGYTSLHNLPVPEPYDRETMIQQLEEWRSKKY